MPESRGELAQGGPGQAAHCPPDGLRERKKAATRQALAIAALRLAVQRGLENVHVEDIADAAGVSARTFNNYFASKYEAICALAMERGQLVGEALRNRPPAEPLMDALISAAVEPYALATHVPDKEWIDGVRLVVISPALQGEYLRTQHAAQQSLAAAIAERVGTDLDTDMFPAVMAGAVSAAIQVAHERWLRSDPPVALVTLIRQAVGQLRYPLATAHADSEFGCLRPPEMPILHQATGRPASTHDPSTPSE